MLCLFAGLMVAWLCQTYPSRLPVWAPTEFSWPTFLCCSGGLWCYGQGLIRTPSKARPSILRQVCFGVGVLSVYAVLQTHFLYFAQHVFFLNRLQHLVMHHIGPFLIAASWPGATLGKGAPQHVLRLTRNRWLSGAIRAVQHPVLASFLFAGLILLWLVPSIHFRAMISPRLYAIMNWSMVLDGLFFWFLVLDPRPQPIVPLSYAVRLLLVFGVQLPQIIAGGVILFTNGDLYAYYDLCGRLFPAIGAQLDQEIGGSIVCFGGGMMSAVAAFFILERMWRDEQQRHAEEAASTEGGCSWEATPPAVEETISNRLPRRLDEGGDSHPDHTERDAHAEGGGRTAVLRGKSAQGAPDEKPGRLGCIVDTES